MKRHSLISDAYIEEQRILHAAPEGYGGKGSKWADTVAWIAKAVDAGSILDYGCGRGSLGKKLAEQGLYVREYDPAIDGKNQRPDFADLVVCTDVLEHVEPKKLEAVMGHLQSLARKAIFLVIALDPANKTLSDGRNAHLILESRTWWEAQIAAQGWHVCTDEEMPLPTPMLNPLKRAKRWIGVVRL